MKCLHLKCNVGQSVIICHDKYHDLNSSSSVRVRLNPHHPNIHCANVEIKTVDVRLDSILNLSQLV